MRHQVKGKKLNRSTASRKALQKSLIKAIIISDKIETTLAKAKFIRPKVEKLITLAKKGDLASRRLLISRIGDKKAVEKLINDIAKRFMKRPGGYTRIQRTSIRKGDNTQLATLSFVERKKTVEKKADTKVVIQKKRKEKTKI